MRNISLNKLPMMGSYYAYEVRYAGYYYRAQKRKSVGE